jgi:outer membrane protein assembly factor BamD
MEERLKNARLAYTNLLKFKGDSKYAEEAQEMLARIDKDLQQFSK